MARLSIPIALFFSVFLARVSQMDAVNSDGCSTPRCALQQLSDRTGIKTELLTMTFIGDDSPVLKLIIDGRGTSRQVQNGYSDLTVFPSEILMMKDLVYLTVVHQPQLSWVPALSSLTSLRDINLQHNSLTSFPDVSGIPMLGYLDVSGNRIKSVPLEFLAGTRLYTLVLTDNMIMEIPDLSTVAPHLQLLYLGENLRSSPTVTALQQKMPGLQILFPGDVGSFDRGYVNPLA